MSLNGFPVQAVVDTAAQKTIIRKDLIERIPNVCVGTAVTLCNAEQGRDMGGVSISGITMQVGGQSYNWDMVAAPIQDTMLLGLDFLQAEQAVIDIPRSTVQFGSNWVAATMLRSGRGDIQIIRVTVKKKYTVPPNSVAYVPVNLDSKTQGSFVVEANGEVNGLMMGAGIVMGHQPSEVTFINVTDRHVTLPSGLLCGTAVEIESVLGKEEESSQTEGQGRNRVRGVGLLQNSGEFPEEGGQESSTGQQEEKVPPDKQMQEELTLAEWERLLPDYVRGIYERMAGNVTEGKEKEAVIRLLVEFEEVFSSQEFDIGRFELLEHEIVLHDLKPFRNAMRCTPLCFQEEEEKTLKHMLAAGVIQPSSSPWSSAPVLRKMEFCVTVSTIGI